MSEQKKPTNINEVQGLSPEARDQLKGIPFPEAQFQYLSLSETEIKMINAFVALGGKFNENESSFETSYTWPKGNNTMGVINIGTQEEKIEINGKKVNTRELLSFDAVAHEIGHALGLHRVEAANAINNIDSYSVEQYIQSKLNTEGDAVLTQYQVQRENKNPNFIKEHEDIYKLIDRLVNDKNINEFGERLFDKDIFDSPRGIEIRRDIARSAGAEIRFATPNSQTGKGNDALNYAEDAKLEYVIARTAILNAVNDYFDNNKGLSGNIPTNELKNFVNSVRSIEKNNEYNTYLRYSYPLKGKIYSFRIDYEDGSPHIKIETISQTSRKTIKEMEHFQTTTDDGMIKIKSTINDFDKKEDTIIVVERRKNGEKIVYEKEVREIKNIDYKKTEETIFEQEKGTIKKNYY